MNNPYYLPSPDNDTLMDSFSRQSGSAISALGTFASNPTPEGAITAGIQAGIGEISDVFKDRRNEKDFIKNLENFNTGEQQFDQFGRPIYSGGQGFDQINSASVNDIGKFQVKDYSGISPAANVVRGIDSLFGGKKRRKKAKKAKKEALGKIEASQNNFNRQNLESNQRLATQQEGLMAAQKRYQNLYSIPNSIY